MMRLEKTVLLGAAWGLLQTGLLLLGAYVSALATDSAFYGEYKRATLQLVILTSVGISVLVGYSLAGIRRVLIALLLAQLVGFLSDFLLVVLFAPGLSLPALAQLSFLLTGFGELVFFVGAIGSFFGAYFREWFQPPRTRVVGWKFHGLGVLSAGVAAMLPIYPYQYDSSPVVLWGSTLPIIPLMAALVLAGLISMILGFRRKSDLNSERVGLLAVVGLLILGLSFISIGFTYGASSTYLSCSGSCLDFQIISAILASSLVIPFGVLVASLFSDQKEGIAELMGNGPASDTR
jgi:hypothetical protein